MKPEREETMKLKHAFFATVALVLTVAPAVYGQVGIEEKAAQAKTVTITCPHNLQIGPVGVPDGWESLGSLPRERLQIKIDAKTQKILCEYGNENALFQTYFIAQKIPAGYDCKIPYPKDYQAVCTKKTGAGPRER